jgi:hypothetical protein
METIGKRISYVRKEKELSIVISAYSEKAKNSAMLIWFIAWTLSGLAVAVYFFRIHENQTKAMMAVWMGFWFYFEFKVWKAYTWRKYGKEIIKIEKSHFFYKRDNRSAGKVADYSTEFIQDLAKYEGRQSDMVSNFMNSYWVIAGETLAFNYLGKEILFGMQLDEKESAALLKLIREELTEK